MGNDCSIPIPGWDPVRGRPRPLFHHRPHLHHARAPSPTTAETEASRRPHNVEKQNGGYDSLSDKMSHTAGNPVFPGWFADPEARIFTDPAEGNGQLRYYVYPTVSDAYERQTYFTAFSSLDLISWTNHGIILDLTSIPWSTQRAAWAPSVTFRPANPVAGRPRAGYYMYFSAGDGAGIGVAFSERPTGPFVDILGRPLVQGPVHGAQAIDADVFVDEDADGVPGRERVYLYFGGWGHCAVGELRGNMCSFFGDEQGEEMALKEVTPGGGYVEGPWMLKRRGIYYLLYSVGGWGDNSYGVSYVTSFSPIGPWITPPAKIVSGNDTIGTSTGHNSCFRLGDDEWYIVYHRRPPGDGARDHRITCIDRMYFHPSTNEILPVIITKEGVEARPLASAPAPELTSIMASGGVPIANETM